MGAGTTTPSVSHVFTFYDPASGIGFYARIRYKPNKEEGSGLSFIYLLGGKVLLYRHVEPIERNRDELEVGGLAFLRVRPMREWRVGFEGTMTLLSPRSEGRRALGGRDIRLSVRFRAINPLTTTGRGSSRSRATPRA